MNGCANCFAHDGPIPLIADPGSFGDCDICGCTGVDVWDVAIWADHFARVLDMYQQSENGSDPPIHVRLQQDWALFSFEDPDRALRLLQAVFGESGHVLVGAGVAVTPRYEEDGAGADHKSRWDDFRRELIYVNRYFPVADFDTDFMRDLIVENLRQLGRGIRLYRGRVSTGRGSVFSADEMGTAPPHLVGPGRGNPVGIAHLYLASDLQTCLKESRASFNGFVSVAVFRVTNDVPYLDLAELRPENPFLVPDSEDGHGLVRSLSASQFLAELGRELSVPTRPGENQIEYVPTQYLCELVKSLGVAGIRYKSALHPEGWNIVLFHANDAEVVPPVELYEVTEQTFGFERRH